MSFRPIALLALLLAAPLAFAQALPAKYEAGKQYLAKPRR